MLFSHDIHSQLSSRLAVLSLVALVLSATMVKLPPAIKQLLTLRNPHPFPNPSAQKLNSILSSTFSEARQRKAENGWLVLSVRIITATLNGFASVVRSCLLTCRCLDLHFQVIDCQHTRSCRRLVSFRITYRCHPAHHST